MAEEVPDRAPARSRTVRQKRSGQRQEAMREAAARLLIEHGPAAVTHRRVAAEAGVPAGSAAYYFPSIEELYAEAVRTAEGMRTAAARAFAEDLTTRRRSSATTARLLIEALYAPRLDADVVTVRLEPMLDASRTPGLLETMRGSWPGLVEVLRTVLRKCGYDAVADTDDVLLVRLLIDAALLHAEVQGSADAVEHAVRTVARLLDLASAAAPRADTA